MKKEKNPGACARPSFFDLASSITRGRGVSAFLFPFSFFLPASDRGVYFFLFPFSFFLAGVAR